MKIVAIIQARMTSTRLPGKILLEVLNKPLLEFQIKRVKQSKYIDEIIVATTTNKTDDPVIDLCEKLGIKYYRGSEQDVLSRYYESVKKYKADIIVRLTSDCPVIDSKEIDKVISKYIEKNKYDYISNTLQRTYPRGMDTEVFSFNTLEKVFNEAINQYEREHVTPYIYNNPSIFRLGNVEYIKDESKHRWTVDVIEDYELIKKIIEELYPKKPNFTLEDILNLFKLYPDWLNINSHIEQKKVGE